jgi:hypothetical protein
MDQNYSSIVSTLLAMMDGLDSRGDVVVIGATNRIDNIDPALRRPGRFDREFVFPLPSKPAREVILQIQTQSWPRKPSAELISSLADQAEGYCGADLKALCTEAALLALGRLYPEVYECVGDLGIKGGDVVIVASDFLRAMQKITPAQQRSGRTHSRRLDRVVQPLVASSVAAIEERLSVLLPAAYAGRHLPHGKAAAETYIHVAEGLVGGEAAAAVGGGCGAHKSLTLGHQPFVRPAPHRPALLVWGRSGMGVSEHVCPAVLAVMERWVRSMCLRSMGKKSAGLMISHIAIRYPLRRYPVFSLELATLFADASSRGPEEACVQLFKEAVRRAPSIIYLPDLCRLWDSTSVTLHHLLVSLICGIRDDAQVNLPLPIPSSHVMSC